MRIDAIVSCVGKEYSDLLECSLPVWLDTLDSLTIVTEPNDPILEVRPAGHLNFVVTDVFTQHQAVFNKGAALCEAYTASNPKDWCLHFDADIDPPKDWRKIAERDSRPGFIYGARRVGKRGRTHDRDRVFWPLGYFQLWHTGDRRTWRWPLFDTWHGYAGAYDANFLELWGRNLWKCFVFRVHHNSEPRKNWFRPGNEHLMLPMLREGLYRYRTRTNKSKKGIPIPDPKFQFYYNPTEDSTWIRKFLEVCRIGGPFLVEAKPSKRVVKGEKVSSKTDLKELKKRIRCSK